MKNRTFRHCSGRRSRKRGTARLFVLGATFAASTAFGPTVASAQQASAGAAQTAAVLQFQVPAGPLSQAAGAFEAVTQIRVTLGMEGIGDIMSPGVSGTMTARQALEQLLMGTSVSFAFTAPDAVTLGVRTAEFVAVTGDAPVMPSPKYTEPLRDTPQTVVVIPRQVIDEQGATSLRDALRNTPGITLTAGEGGTAPGDNLLIRGFSARNDVYVDGARDTGVVSRDTFNTEAVVVAKGPSSVVSGRGATGGSVNLVTKAAGVENFANARLTGGSADQKRVTADINRRLSPTAGLRLNVMWEDSGVPGRDAVQDKAWGFAPSVAVGVGRATEVTFNYQHLEQDNLPDHGLPNGLPEMAVDQGLTVRDLDFGNFYGLIGRDYEKTRADFGTVTVQHQVNNRVTLRNLTRYGQNDLDRVVTSPRSASASNSGSDPGFDGLQPQIRRTDAKYQFRTDKGLTNQTDLNTMFSTGDVSHTLAAGVELAYESQPSYAVTDSYANGRPPVTNLFNPQPTDLYVPALERTGASTDASSTTGAVYLFDTIKPNEQWQVDAGLRWDRIGVDYATTDTDGTRADYSRVDAALSGKAGLVFKPVARGSLYGAYTTSFNPSFDGSYGLTLADRSGSLENLPPERTHNVEVGTKWDLDRDLAFTAAAFHTDKTNAKTRDEAGATVLLGDQVVRGVEFSVAGSLTRDWSIFSGLSLMDSEVRESGNADEIGRQLAYVPKRAFNLWTTYRIPVARLTLGAGTEFTDGYFFNNTNALTSDNAAAIQDLTRYWLFNAMVSLEVSPHLTLQLNGTNLADRRYVERGYGGHFIPGPGRGIVVSPVISF